MLHGQGQIQNFFEKEGVTT